MASSNKHAITSKQMMCFLISSQIGFGIITLPSTLADSVGHDGWISTLLAGIISIFCSFIISKLVKRYSNKSIFQINIYLYGKYLGIFLDFIILLYLILITGVVFRLFSEFVKITILKETPLIAISAFTAIPTLYLTWKGLKVVSRFTVTLPVTYILILIIFILVCKNARITFVMPVGQAETGAILNGMLLSGFSYLGIELLSMIYPYISDKENVTKHTLMATGFTTIFFTTVVFTSTLYIGEWKLKMLAFPLFNIITSIRIPVIERLDLLFVMFWFPVMGAAIRTYFFCSYNFISKLLGLNDKKLHVFLYIIPIIMIGRIPKDLSELYKYTNLIGYAGLGIIAFLLFSYLFSFINKRGCEGENNKVF